MTAVDAAAMGGPTVLERLGSRSRLLVLALALALTPSLAVAGNALDGLLRESHLPGEPAVGISGIATHNAASAARRITSWCQSADATAARRPLIIARNEPLSAALASCHAYSRALTVARWEAWLQLAFRLLAALLLVAAVRAWATGGVRTLGRVCGALVVWASLVESFFLLLLLYDRLVPRADWLLWVPWLCDWIARIALGGLAAALLVAFVDQLHEDAERHRQTGTVNQARSLGATLGALRAHVVLALIFPIGMLVLATGADQIADVIRRLPGEPLQLVFAVLAFCALAVVMTGSAQVVLEAVPIGQGAARLSLRWLAGVAAAVLVIGALLLIAVQAVGLLVLGGLLALALVTFWVRGAAPARASPIPGMGRHTIPLVLGIVPLLTVSLVTVRAEVVDAYVATIAHSPRAAIVFMLVGALCLQFLAWLAVFRIHHRVDPAWSKLFERIARPLPESEADVAARPREARPTRVFLFWVSVSAALLVIGLVALVWPLRAAGLGALALLAVFFMLAALFCSVLLVASELIRPPVMLARLGLNRIPFFVLIALWLALAAQFDDSGYHHVRTLAPVGAAEQSQPTLERWFGNWSSEQAQVGWMREPPPPAATTATDVTRRRVIPMLLVSAEGGGIRAAFWTALALQCALEGADSTRCPAVAKPAPGSALRRRAALRNALFLASGASGGSVGIAFWAAHVINAAPPGTARAPTGDREDWVEKRLGDDFVAPTIASMLFSDAPNAFLRIGRLPDRAAALERAFEQSYVSDTTLDGRLARTFAGTPLPSSLLATPFFRSFLARYDAPGLAAQPPVPLMILNSTSVTDGCRIDTAPLALAVHGEARESVGAPTPLNCLSIDRFVYGSPPPTTQSETTLAQLIAAPGPTQALVGTTDIAALLCRDVPQQARDMRLSTAAVLSARFPYVAPSGRLDRTCAPSLTEYGVDGGYRDNSGSAAIVETWQVLRPLVRAYNAQPDSTSCIVPILMHVDNHYNGVPAPSAQHPPNEALVPVTTTSAIRDGWGNAERQAEAALFSNGDAIAPSSPVRSQYVDVTPTAHPGLEAPLGWTLSHASQRDLEDQMAKSSAMASLRKWLWGKTLRCDGRH